MQCAFRRRCGSRIGLGVARRYSCAWPPAKRATALSLAAAHRYRSGRRGLNLGDCLHYACAKYYRVPILATAEEFQQTDLETVP